MRVTALVAARGGSERVPNKNLRAFSGTTLLDIKLAQLSRLRAIDDVVVSSEDDLILETARRHGCVAHPRPQDLASSAASMSDVYRYVAQELDTDVVVYANCTSPLVRDCTVEALVTSYLDLSDAYDSLNTASSVREFLLLEGRPLNYDPTHQPRSQDLPPIAALNFAVSILTREAMIERRNVLGASPLIHLLDQVEGIDIDTPVDFAVAEFLYQTNGGEHYLRGF
jgi:CMP-N,N'-diacetyllegionaminic acid synthase